MIHALKVQNFKRLLNFSAEIAPLTLLTGMNGTGKSTLIQSILIAHQSALVFRDQLPLAAEPGLNLGTAFDVLSIDAADPVIRIQLDKSEWEFDAGTHVSPESNYLRTVRRPSIPHTDIGNPARFTYLNAERVGPRMIHPTEHQDIGRPIVGEDGRFVAQALAQYSRFEVDPRRRHSSAGDISTLVSQTEAWMTTLVGKVDLQPNLISRTSNATLWLRTEGFSGEWMLPTNTGFGVSYALPIVVAGLTAAEGGVLIVDSPEAHLHPAAQSAMAVFLSRVAASGVQVIIETHSDHILNGIRRSIAQSIIDSNDLAIYFFGHDLDAQRLSIKSDGKLSSWPPGFFDQIDQDLRTILGF